MNIKDIFSVEEILAKYLESDCMAKVLGPRVCFPANGKKFCGKALSVSVVVNHYREE